MEQRPAEMTVLITALACLGWPSHHAVRSATGNYPASLVAPLTGGALSATARVLRIERGDGITLHHLAALQQRSSTARDLLDRVARLPDAILIVRPYPLLVRTTRLYGRSLFWVEGERLFGHIQYQTESLGNDRPLCILAHELAHAVEVAAVDRRSGTARIREFVLSRAVGADPDNWLGAETPFPRAVAHRVWLELLGRERGPSTLDALALEHHVLLPAAQLTRASGIEPGVR
jgi:hypothetical protein